MADLYEPLAPIDTQPPPPPPSAPPPAQTSKESGASKGSKIFSENVTGNTAMSAVTDTQFGGADGQSAYSVQPESVGKSKQKLNGGSKDSGAQKRSKGACICMIVSGIFGTLSLGGVIGATIALVLKL